MIKSISKDHIENAAWDLALVQEWRRRAEKGIDSNEPVLLISGDKAVQDMARRMISDDESGAISTMREVWGKNTADGKRVYQHYSQLWQAVSSDTARRPPNHEQQLAIMRQLEESVLGC